ncbi:MAG: hypothetical protein GY899_08565 [Verrucomicrobiaceae bacterium]|nr:hypothetical protein [Verrucomicrobiaceae bacterium]
MNRLILLVSAMTAIAAYAQQKSSPPIAYGKDFQDGEIGVLPDGIMEIDGIFKVTKGEAGKKYLVMEKEPLTENAVILGPSVKGGATVSAKIRSYKKRRSYPRFAVGLHGISGFRLRVVPSKSAIELVKNEEPVMSVPFKWTPDEWTMLELDIALHGENWRVEGRVWSVGEKRPVKPTVAYLHKGSPGQGKASLWGTAYSGREIHFDDVQVRSSAQGS